MVLIGIIASKGHFPEEMAIYYIKQLLTRLSYRHQKYICHRDIKPENLLITNAGTLKIADFGLAVIVEESKGVLTGITGTPAYLAPEVINHIMTLPCRDLFN